MTRRESNLSKSKGRKKDKSWKQTNQTRPDLEKQRNETDKPEVTITQKATTTQRQNDGFGKRTRIGD